MKLSPAKVLILFSYAVFFIFTAEIPASAAIDDILSAAASGNNYVIADLIKNGENINSKDSDGNTPLMLAVSNEREETVRLFGKQGNQYKCYKCGRRQCIIGSMQHGKS